jgi:hypothetical protein
LEHLGGGLATKEDAHEGYEEVVHGGFVEGKQPAAVPESG